MGSGIAYHGYLKIFEGGMPGFIEGVAKMGFATPVIFAWVAALSEFVGGILIVIGLGTRFAAFFVFATMFVAAFIAHGADPLQKKEMALAYLTMAGTLILTGGGAISFGGKGK